jgi:hypothetical protein
VESLTTDQILELHTNLTVIQGRLLEILNGQFSEAKGREMQQRKNQKKWTEFTMSLEESLKSISANTTVLLRELFSGLLRLQSFTRESTRFIGDELKTLEEDVRNVRGEIHRVHDDIDALGITGVAKVEELAGLGQHQLSMV